jgi:hypothetical protein
MSELTTRYPENTTTCPPPQASGPPAPSAPYYDPDAEHIQKLYAIAARYEIQDEFIKAIKMIYGWDIVLLCDDSGSMSQQSDSPPTTNAYTTFSRWDELKRIVEHIMFIGTALDTDGVDLYFLNRRPVTNVNCLEQVNHTFSTGPGGGTPLITAFNRILYDKGYVNEKGHIPNEKKLLIIIATDGEPNDYGTNSISEFKKCLQNKPDNVYVSVVACTGDKQTMKYLNDLDKDKSIKNFDVCDDYNNERTEVLEVQDPDFRFSFGDYVVKCILGSSNKYFDNLDQVNVKTGKKKVTVSSCGCFGW